MKHVWIISCLLFVCSCNTVREDFVVNEDYEKLFPSKEIEKPENKRGELLVQLCDPDQALENYKYPGTETPNGADQYKITLMCSFQEKRWDGNLTKDVSAQYKVKYINEKKELVTISCGKRNIGNAGEDADVLFHKQSVQPYRRPTDRYHEALVCQLLLRTGMLRRNYPVQFQHGSLFCQKLYSARQSATENDRKQHTHRLRKTPDADSQGQGVCS